MKTTLLILLSFLGLCASGQVIPPQSPTTVRLIWDASPAPGLTNYWIYQGVAANTYTNRIAAGTNLTLTVSNIVRGTTYYFAATCADTNGFESLYSTEAVLRFPVPPLNVRVTP